MHLPFLHLEDVFLTGFAAENCAIARFNTNRFHPQPVKFGDLNEEDILWQIQRIKITYDRKVPEKYLGLEGWPPGKDRHMPNYIKPDQDTFPLRPSKAHFKGCEILVIVHSAIDSFSMRRGLRDTWIQFVTQKRVANVSVIFLIGNQNMQGIS